MLSERQLNHLLKEYIDHHTGRPHQGLNGDAPVVTKRPDAVARPIKLILYPVGGGLHHRTNGSQRRASILSAFFPYELSAAQ